MRKVHIATSRDIGAECINWAINNMPPNYVLTPEMCDADVIISVLYDKIINHSMLNNKECFNFHPGILPEYGGTCSNSWALINNEAKAGVSLHIIDGGIDTGDIIEIREFIISKHDTAFSLHKRSNNLIYKMFKDWFKDLLEGNFIAAKQPEQNKKIYYRKDFNRMKNITRLVKAFYFPGKESCYFFNSRGKKVYIDYC